MNFTLFASVSFILISSREECGCWSAPGQGLASVMTL
jgi:hypothetical protein